MYSNELMKFLFSYQKEESPQKEPKAYKIKFNKERGGKLADILLTINKK